MVVKVVFSPTYLDYNFGPNHPFLPQRAKRFLTLVENSKIKYGVLCPPAASDEQILLVHTTTYLKIVKERAQKHRPLTPDTPLNPKILNTAYDSVGGSILAAREALKNQLTINLLGGLHHAGSNFGGGFCIFADHAIAIRQLQKERIIKKAMIYDLDVHAGNGTQEIFYSDPTVFTISLHQDPATLYPGTGFADQTGEGEGKGFHLNIPLPPQTTGEKYIAALNQTLTHHQTFKPDLTIIILGVDTFIDDPLANLKLEEDDYYKIGRGFQNIKPLAVLCAGGYSPQTPHLWLKFLKGLTK